MRGFTLAFHPGDPKGQLQPLDHASVLGLGCHRSHWSQVAGEEAAAPGRARGAEVCAVAAVWEAEPLKPGCPLEALRKSDCDLFGLVTIQVWGRQLFIRCGSLTNWLGSDREDNPSDPGQCWGGKRDPPTCSLPRAARTSVEMRIPTCGCAAASYPPQPARIPSPGWRGLGCSRQALSREISAPSAAEPSPQVPGRSPKLRSALQVTQF